MTDVVAAKNSLIEKLQQQLADQKRSYLVSSSDSDDST